MSNLLRPAFLLAVASLIGACSEYSSDRLNIKVVAASAGAGLHGVTVTAGMIDYRPARLPKRDENGKLLESEDELHLAPWETYVEVATSDPLPQRVVSNLTLGVGPAAISGKAGVKAAKVGACVVSGCGTSINLNNGAVALSQQQQHAAAAAGSKSQVSTPDKH